MVTDLKAFLSSSEDNVSAHARSSLLVFLIAVFAGAQPAPDVVWSLAVARYSLPRVLRPFIPPHTLVM